MTRQDCFVRPYRGSKRHGGGVNGFPRLKDQLSEGGFAGGSRAPSQFGVGGVARAVGGSGGNLANLGGGNLRGGAHREVESEV